MRSFKNLAKRKNALFLETTFFISSILRACGLSLEDKRFYDIQFLSLGKVGHSSNTQVSLHPSKVKVFNAKNTTSTSRVNNCLVSSSTASEESCLDLDLQDNYEPFEIKKSRKGVYKLGCNLVITESLSTNKSARICKKLNKNCIEIETTS